jgi:hypothetical protein
MALKQIEIRVKGKNTMVPAAEIEGRNVITKGGWVKTASIHDEQVMVGELVKDPKSFVAQLKKSGLKADVLTFFQRPPNVKPQFAYHFEWDNYAAVTVTSFEAWWDKLPQEARKNTRRAAKRGVVVKPAVFDEAFALGVQKMCNETPVRQGRPFWHYNKDLATIIREHTTYPDRSEFIGAYLGDELIGFIKMVYVDKVAFLFHILAYNSHYDKRPMNAMLAKAVEVCAQKGVGYFVYDKYSYGNKKDSTLLEFKRRNGFEQVDYPRYYIPLTLKGRVHVALRLHRGLMGILPEPAIRLLLKLRERFYQKKEKAATNTETKEVKEPAEAKAAAE